MVVGAHFERQQKGIFQVLYLRHTGFLYITFLKKRCMFFFISNDIHAYVFIYK